MCHVEITESSYKQRLSMGFSYEQFYGLCRHRRRKTAAKKTKEKQTKVAKTLSFTRQNQREALMPVIRTLKKVYLKHDITDIIWNTAESP